MLAKYFDKLLFALGLVLLGVSYSFFGGVSSNDPSATFVSIQRPKEFVPRTFEPPKLETVRWADAKAQPAGPRWIYDLFTPPLVFLDPKTASLSPEPPKLTLDPNKVGGIPFPFVLVDISRDLYRIQLSGFFGEAPDYRVSLEDRENGLPLIGRPGTIFQGAEVELKSFNVERRAATQGGTRIVEEVATAVIVDQRTGEEITLAYPGEPRYLPTPKAEFRTNDEVPVDFILRAGDKKTFGDFSYAVVEITEDPKVAVVVREAIGDIPEIRREFTPTPREELPVERPPTIQGGSPSNAPFMLDSETPPENLPFPSRPGVRPPFPPQPRRN